MQTRKKEREMRETVHLFDAVRRWLWFSKSWSNSSSNAHCAEQIEPSSPSVASQGTTTTTNNRFVIVAFRAGRKKVEGRRLLDWEGSSHSFLFSFSSGEKTSKSREVCASDNEKPGRKKRCVALHRLSAARLLAKEVWWWWCRHLRQW